MSYTPPNPNGQADSAHSAPVVVASDQTAIASDAQLATPRVVSGSGAALNEFPIPSTEVKGSWVAVHLIGTFSATVTWEQSNDNTNWVNLTLVDQTQTNNLTYGTTGNAPRIYAGPVAGRYMRARISAYTSGTVNATALFSAVTKQQVGLNSLYAVNSDTITSVTGTSAAATADFNLVYNGTNWERIRTTDSAAGTTGTGLLGVGALGYDGTNYQRVKTDSNGVLVANLSPSTTGGWSVSSQTALTTTATVSTAAGKFAGGSFMNLNSAPAYLQVFDTTSTVTLGTTTPTFVQPIPANSVAANGLAYVFEIGNGISITNGIKVAATTTATGSTTVSTGLTGFVLYK